MKLKKILFFTIAVLISRCGLAGGAPHPTPLQTREPRELSNGFYIEPYVGYGYVNVNTLENDSGRNGLSAGFAFGYKFTDNWAMDAGYTRMPKANVTTYYLYMSLKYILPINASWDIFAKLGPAFVRGSEDFTHGTDREFALFAGLGGTYWMSQNIGFVIQSALTTGHDNVPLTFNLTGGIDYFF